MKQDQDVAAASADLTGFLESMLRAIVAAAGSYGLTLFDFLFRPRVLDGEILGADAGPTEESDRESGHPHLGPLSYLLISLMFYFYVYPRREEGPTRLLIDASPAPISRALDRIEATLARPDLPSVLFVVGPLVLLFALHARLTTSGFRLLGGRARFDQILAVTCYSIGSLVAAFALSAVVGATLTDRAVAGTLRGAGLAAYLVGMVVPFVATFVWCVVRHFSLTRAAAGETWARSAAVVVAATLALGSLVALLLAASGMRVGPPA